MFPQLNVCKRSERKKVVIVGAGLAGLSAAWQLTASQLFDVTILEAKNCAGGRVNTLYTEFGPLEIGAQWLHGYNNELYELANHHGLLSDIVSQEKEGIFVTNCRKKLSHNLVQDINCTVDNIVKESYEPNNENTSDIDCSFGDYLHKSFYEIFDQNNLDDEEAKIINDILEWNFRSLEAEKSCEDLYKLPLSCASLCKVSEFDDLINFKKGFGSLVQVLIDCLPKSIIKFNKAVDKIHWAEGHMKVTCRDGHQELCDNVIVTSSAGYLKKNPGLFSPPLPPKYEEALKCIGFGTTNKIFLVFDEPWWKSSIKGIQTVWTKNSKLDSINNNDWRRYCTGFDLVDGLPNVLLCWVSSYGATIMEQLPDHIIRENIEEYLKIFINIDNLPSPKKIIRSKWGMDEFTLGSYSYRNELNISSGEAVQQVLTTPIGRTKNGNEGVILLAGEALSKHFFSSSHGAFQSGRDQAIQLINLQSSI